MELVLLEMTFRLTEQNHGTVGKSKRTFVEFGAGFISPSSSSSTMLASLVLGNHEVTRMITFLVSNVVGAHHVIHDIPLSVDRKHVGEDRSHPQCCPRECTSQ